MRAHVERVATVAKRVLRVSAYLSVVAIAAALLFVSRARAALGDAALALGGELSEMGPALGPANRVRLNGERVNVASAMVDESPEAVLDRFEGECRAHAGGIVEEMQRLAASVHAPPSTEGAPAIGVIRKDGEHRGAVACLARDGNQGSQGFLRGLSAMLATGDLAALGELRYVLAERSPGATRTHVIAAWTDGPFRFAALFPKGGADAPGSDPANAPRPDGSRRLLTASIESVPYGVRVYDVAGAPDAVLASYDRAMPAVGWSAVAGVADGLSRAGRPGRAFAREGVDLLVFADVSRADAARSVVSILEMPPSPK